MSLIIAIFVAEGIVLASDSRLTYNNSFDTDNNGVRVHVENYGIHFTDTSYKTFLCPNNIGLSTCGGASINGKPITGYVEEFIRINMNENTDVDEVPLLLNSYFNQFSPIPTANFFVAGYHSNDDSDDSIEQRLWRVPLGGESIKIDTLASGAQWEGEKDTLSRIFAQLYLKQEDQYILHEHHQVPWDLFNLQDAIDFAQYAVKMTIDAMRFQMRPKTVGGEIDILVLKPKSSFWIAHKELHQ